MEIDCVSADESPPPQGSKQDSGRRRRESSKGKKGHWKIGRKNKSQSQKIEGYTEEGDNMAHRNFFQG